MTYSVLKVPLNPNQPTNRMTLNGVMAVILRYFTELMYNVIVKQLPRFQNLLLIVYDHIKTICAIIQRLFWPSKLITRFDVHR